ncbi:DUF3422 family protein [Elstera cyanobacteriorum]|uniref:DUF3422 family protein n=1 Tax=Elstera cyanobacteriorum TaxID=2022747 RepID=UPI002356EFA3|nr:DUF3422 domain-containing protein [Elstera cyanobacteriorum]MCK6441097.1 DUF3422 domain-containing protein [Elstera cyanobacteriorum]
MSVHFLRELVLGEVHARPFTPLTTPRRVLHFAFFTDLAAARADRDKLLALCATAGAAAPLPDAKHHRLTLPPTLGGGSLRWEQHSEFTTYTLDFPDESGAIFPPCPAWARFEAILPPPGPLLVAVDLQIVPAQAGLDLTKVFDPASLAVSAFDFGAALVATDFRADGQLQAGGGTVRLLVQDQGLTPQRAGALVQRLLEVETYRLFALLGLPEAHRLGPIVRRIEADLTRIARAMAEARDLVSDNALLDELTLLAAELEAEANAASYRFSASRAYDGIIQQRLAALGDRSVGEYPTIGAFLARRLAPAMRTCTMLEERLETLAGKLSRAAHLLRTRVDVAIEQQNRSLLEAMNLRARQQFRLQQTVEGLSIAAIAYYVVSLAAYVFKGLKEAGLPLDPTIGTALAVPPIVAAVALTVRRIRRHHGKETE